MTECLSHLELDCSEGLDVNVGMQTVTRLVNTILEEHKRNEIRETR